MKERTNNNVKYLHPKGGGLNPDLFVSDIGIVHEKQIDNKILEKFEAEGVAIVESWKKGEKLSFIGFSTKNYNNRIKQFIIKIFRMCF